MAFHLSKTRFTTGVQCPKMLWLKTYRSELFDQSVVNQDVLDTGSEVGDLAMGLFGDFTEVPFGDLNNMIRTTSDLLASNTKVICEASFATEDGFCSADILINNGDNQVELYEVKSSTEVKDIYLYDLGYQCHILRQAGLTVTRACLVHINSKYIRHRELNLQEFFHIEDLTATVHSMQDEIESKINFLKSYMQQEDEPFCEISNNCFAPYECGFWNHCTENLPHPNVFDVSSLQRRTKFKHYNSGIVSFEELSRSGVLKGNNMLQVEHELHDCAPYVNKAGIQECLNQLTYPLYFLDFETFNPAVPLYENSKPYQQIVFQYSLHYIEEEGGELKHKEYLAYPGEDPRRKLAEQLCQDIPMNMCVTAYNMSFEKGRIKELAELYPDLHEHLMNIHDHIYDLMIPFQQKDYYCRAMQGSFSIKYVLPALFPNAPELDYHNLEGVHNGAEASDTFKRMANMNLEELEQYRKHLLKYCGLDTYAMVKVWEKLREIAI